MPHREKILVVMPSWIGDTVMSHPLLAELQRHFNDCEIDVLARPFTRDLLDLIPQINKKSVLLGKLLHPHGSHVPSRVRWNLPKPHHKIIPTQNYLSRNPQAAQNAPTPEGNGKQT